MLCQYNVSYQFTLSSGDGFFGFDGLEPIFLQEKFQTWRTCSKEKNHLTSHSHKKRAQLLTLTIWSDSQSSQITHVSSIYSNTNKKNLILERNTSTFIRWTDSQLIMKVLSAFNTQLKPYWTRNDWVSEFKSQPYQFQFNKLITFWFKKNTAIEGFLFVEMRIKISSSVLSSLASGVHSFLCVFFFVSHCFMCKKTNLRWRKCIYGPLEGHIRKCHL